MHGAATTVVAASASIRLSLTSSFATYGVSACLIMPMAESGS